ncbi:unnamed protein product [Anisakis simplex]|uniref:Uncharacterized protein n=1 Tax=Anisakis simplex TaxID=6269 RepID=A0A0M3K8E7_ANISI|nr:unnamed protein product [Anisakis simplex]
MQQFVRSASSLFTSQALPYIQISDNSPTLAVDENAPSDDIDSHRAVPSPGRLSDSLLSQDQQHSDAVPRRQRRYIFVHSF